MKLLSSSLVGCVVLSATGSPALADWQYTKWGMTKENVVQASGGMAQPGSYTYDDNGTSRTINYLSTTYQSDGINFKATFNFSKANKLVSVELSPLDTGDCGSLSEKLKHVYGVPAINKERVIQVSTMEWTDSKNSNFVKLLLLGATGSCVLTYYEYKEPGQQGGL